MGRRSIAEDRTGARDFWQAPSPDGEGASVVHIRNPVLRRLVRPRSLELPVLEMRSLHAFVAAGILLVLLSYYKLDLIFSTTTTTGGDTGAHIYGVWWAREHLIGDGFQASWSPGWLAGVPMMHFYFPLVIGLQALLSYVIPFEVAFKLGTMLGPFLLPAAVYLMFRWLRTPFPTPLIGAILSLGFLFMDSFTIYGGNLPSTLAGEYTFSVSLALSFMFFGLIYRVATNERAGLIGPAFVLAGVVLSHLLPALMVIPLLPFLVLWARDTHGLRLGITRLATVFGLAFLLTAFWSIPMAARLHYTTSFNVGPIRGLSLALPKQLWIYLLGFVLGGILALLRRDRRALVLVVPGAVALILYLMAPRGLVWNGRWLPFWYLSAFLMTAYFLGAMVPTFARFAWRRRARVLSIGLVVAILFGMGGWLLMRKNSTFIDDWITYNYEGYEKKPTFGEFEQIMDEVADLPPGRLTTEDSSTIGELGTSFAFMTLPYWVDRPTLEGLYFESSVTTPFFIMLQTEMSEAGPATIPGLPYHAFDLAVAAEHMRLLDVRHYISVGEAARQGAEASGDFEHVADVDNYSIFSVKNSPGSVVVPKFQPVVVEDMDQRDAFVAWWTNLGDLDIPIATDGPSEWKRVPTIEGLPRDPLPHGGESYEAEVSDNQISFTTDAVGEPHWIKFSYFPNWKVEGAEGPYHVSPSMMMVIPTQEEVTLTYKRTWAEWLGLLLTLSAIVLLIVPKTRKSIRALGS